MSEPHFHAGEDMPCYGNCLDVEAVAALTPEECPTCGNQREWPILAEQGRYRDELRSCTDLFHTPEEP